VLHGFTRVRRWAGITHIYTLHHGETYNVNKCNLKLHLSDFAAGQVGRADASLYYLLMIVLQGVSLIEDTPKSNFQLCEFPFLNDCGRESQRIRVNRFL
jgi:hypothetical protein